MEESDPQILWRRFGAGDRQAFNALYRRYEQDVLRFCQALLGDPDDAREAANTTWAAVWRTRNAAERDVPLRPWLFRIAHNEAIDILRRRRSHDQLDVGLPAPDDTAADAELHERLATLRVDLLTLTDHQRTALVLREMSGLSHEEIATVLDISPGAAKQSIYEARQALIDAEGGRSLPCDLVRRDISAGDRRVLRHRRIRAHLRGCAACSEFAAAVQRQRRDLRVLVPLPAGAALLPRIASLADVAGRGAAVTELGGPVATKVAAAAVAVVLGTGAAGVMHPPDRSDAEAGADQPLATSSVAGSPVRGGSPKHAELRRIAWGGESARPATTVRDPAVAGTPPATTAAASAKPDGSAATSTPTSSAQARRAGNATPPREAATASPSTTPPRDATGKAKPTPPGQAKVKANAKPTPSAAPPGQAKVKAKPTPSAAAPGQAKAKAKPTPSAAPPGQAKANTNPAPTQPSAPPSAPAAAVPQPSHAEPAGQAAQPPESSPTALPGAGPAGVGQAHGHGGR
jgi:RNA polymerase sigma factor (sigma-70 family)